VRFALWTTTRRHDETTAPFGAGTKAHKAHKAHKDNGPRTDAPGILELRRSWYQRLSALAATPALRAFERGAAQRAKSVEVNPVFSFVSLVCFVWLRVCAGGAVVSSYRRLVQAEGRP